MEKILYMFLPMALLFKLFVTKKETSVELFIKYLAVCFVNNFFTSLASVVYYPNVVMYDDKIIFFIRYSLAAVGIGIVMAILYRLFINFCHIKIEVVTNEKNKRS